MTKLSFVGAIYKKLHLTLWFVSLGHMKTLHQLLHIMLLP